MDPDLIIETSTFSDDVFKMPAMPKPKDVNLTVMATSEERTVQVQKKEDPFKNFVEIETPSYIFLTEEQYYARDSLSGKCMILYRETLRPKITEPASTPSIAAAIISSTAKTAPKLKKPFGALAKDEWEPKGSTIDQLQKEANTFLYKYGTASTLYIQKKKHLDSTIWMKEMLRAEWDAIQDEDDKQARSQDDSQKQDEDEP